MYTKPAVERFGTVRDLTLVGISGVSDGLTVIGITGSVDLNGVWTNCPPSGS